MAHDTENWTFEINSTNSHPGQEDTMSCRVPGSLHLGIQRARRGCRKLMSFFMVPAGGCECLV